MGAGRALGDIPVMWGLSSLDEEVGLGAVRLWYVGPWFSKETKQNKKKSRAHLENGELLAQAATP